MHNAIVSRRFMASLFRSTTALVASLVSAGVFAADECPSSAADSGGQRRDLAKRWFSTGEELSKAADYAGAVRAYRCSLKLAPQGLTAYNLAQVAEQAGDLELALSSYKQYLFLVPNARDQDEVERRVSDLREHVDASNRTRTASAPPRDQLVLAESPRVRSGGDGGRRVWIWASYSGAAVLIVGGVVTNLLARSRMDTCRSTWEAGGRSSTAVSNATPACDDGLRLAYASYGFFGLAGAAIAAGTFLVLRPSPSDDVTMVPLPKGGLAVSWRRSY